MVISLEEEKWPGGSRLCSWAPEFMQQRATKLLGCNLNRGANPLEGAKGPIDKDTKEVEEERSLRGRGERGDVVVRGRGRLKGKKEEEPDLSRGWFCY